MILLSIHLIFFAKRRLASVSDGVATTPEDWDAEDSDFTYDGNGNVTAMLENGAPAISSIKYDHRNLPTSLVNRNGDMGSYRYNASGQRIFKQIGSQTPEYYLMDGTQTIAIWENGAVKYWNLLANGVIGRHKANGEKLYYLKDHLGSTRAVVDGTGIVLEAHDYYPFGLLMPGRSYTNGEETKEKFTGKELDGETGWYHLGSRPLMSALSRFPSLDRFAEKYPSLSPYHFVANNPVVFFDANGDSIVITAAMANSEALANYASTQEGYNYLSQFAYEGQAVTINGKTFTFEKAGKFSTQNIKFMGTKADAGTTPVNSILGRGYVDTQNGVQSYEIFLSDSKNIGQQMDAAFHEVQHSSMFAEGKFTGKLNQNVMDFHHGNMMLPRFWAPHERFINQANQQLKTNLNADNIYRFLYNQIQDPGVAKKVVEILIRYNSQK